MSESSKAIISSIRVYPHPTADRIQLEDVKGFQVVVDLTVKTGDVGIFFPEGLQLAEEFATANDLIRRKDPVTGEASGGFFEPNCRVRAQKFRHQKSEGFWIPLSSLSYLGTVNVHENDLVDEVNGHIICRKYVTPATQRSQGMGGGQQKVSRDILMFPKHKDTDQLRFHYDSIPKGLPLVITLKVHGTSQRVGHVLVERKLPWYQRWMLKLGVPIQTQEWAYAVGTRNVVLKSERESGGYYSDNFRYDAAKPFTVSNSISGPLHRGEVVYYEVVGYSGHKSPIMGSVSAKDKEIEKEYGKQVTYSYGCNADLGQHDIYVYRITQVNDEGRQIDLSWPDVKRRCEQLGVKHVPELHYSIYDGDTEALKTLVESLSDGRDPIDPTHPREGVVVRVDSNLRLLAYKNKGFTFKVLEGLIREQPNFVDAEEVS